MKRKDHPMKRIAQYEDCEPMLKNPALIGIMSRIQDASVRLHKLHDNGSHLADKVFGQVPTAVLSANGSGNAPDGTINMIVLCLDDLHAAIARCEGDMDRLCSL
jgi:hypothetical protein